jgi:hypothetical protein
VYSLSVRCAIAENDVCRFFTFSAKTMFPLRKISVYEKGIIKGLKVGRGWREMIIERQIKEKKVGRTKEKRK